jgi:hypothetical protein
MTLPKVKFKIASIDYEISNLYGFCFSRRWSKRLFEVHPELKEVLVSRGKKEQLRLIEDYVNAFHKEKKSRIENQKMKYQTNWNKVNDKYMSVLSDVLETGWPKRDITAFVSISPINPRSLIDWTFSVYYESSKKKSVGIISHEILHFLYFKKWKEAFPYMKELKFEPTISKNTLKWRLSEILAPVILNALRIKKILKVKPREYDIHKKIKIGSNSLTQHFALIYKESLENNEPFSEFLKKSYAEIKKYGELIYKLP